MIDLEAAIRREAETLDHASLQYQRALQRSPSPTRVRAAPKMRRAVFVSAVVVVLGIGVSALVTRSAEDAKVSVALAGATDASMMRPVLDTCKPTYASEATWPGILNDPRRVGEVFAVPSLGASGPLALLQVYDGSYEPYQGPMDSGSGVSIIGSVAGSPVYSWFKLPGISQTVWNLAGSRHADVSAVDLSQSDLLALSNASATGEPLPAGLVSIGRTSEVAWARSRCVDGDGLIAAQVTAIQGTAASRYAYMLARLPVGLRWDQGETTFWVDGQERHVPASTAAVHQASAEDWKALLSGAPVPPTGR